MKAEHSGTTAELHQRNQAVAALSEKAATAEKQLRDETEDKEKKAAGLQVPSSKHAFNSSMDDIKSKLLVERQPWIS